MRRTAVLILLCLLPFGSTAMAAPPKVAISYRPSLDTACALVRGYHIDAAWKDELSKNVDRFRDMWAQTGPGLLSTTEKITGKRFPNERVSAYLSLCNFPSESLPLGVVVNMRYALSSFTSHPVPMRYKVGALYHEVLHKFVDAHMPAHSALLARYHGEAPRVREHLHLLALLKAVYLELGMKDELAELTDIDRQLPGGVYKRAWAIIDESADGYRAYVAELRASER